jgi:hypothetical protein
MSKILFVFAENTDDRDRVKYLDMCSLKRGYINLTGACFSGVRISDIDFENITSILTEEEIKELLLCEKEAKHLIEKLESEENKKLFDEVLKEEREFMKDEYNLTDEDINEIYNEYYLEYRDRGIISVVFDSVEECGREEAFSLGTFEERLEPFIDFEKYGESLLEGEQYLKLSDGRVVYLNY